MTRTSWSECTDHSYSNIQSYQSECNIPVRIKNEDVPNIPTQDGEYTLWELNKLLKTELFNKTTFYNNDIKMSGNFARTFFEEQGISVFEN